MLLFKSEQNLNSIFLGNSHVNVSVTCRRKGAFYNPDFHQYLVPHDHIASIPRRPPPPPPSAAPVQKRQSPANSSKRLGSSSKKAGTKRKSTFTSAVAAKVNKNTEMAPCQLSYDLTDVVDCVKRAPPHSAIGRYDTAATTFVQTNADASTKKAPSKARRRSTSASPIASLTAKAAPVLNAVERTTSEYQEKRHPRLSTPTLIAGSTSCIMSQSALWRTSDHYSTTPRVQNPRVKSNVLQHVEPFKRPDQMALSAPKRGTTFARKDGKRPAWISPSVPIGCDVRGDDMEHGRIYSASSIPEYVEVAGPRRRATDNRPVWISPSMPSGSIHVGADENAPPFACDARDVNLARVHPQGVKIPTTPIATRKRPKDEEKDTLDSIYGSPMMPTPLSLQRHESSSSFLDPFVGEMGNLSYALDMAFADEDVSGDNALHNNCCEPIEDNVDVTGRVASFYRSACASMENSDGHAYEFASANHSSIMLCPSLATSCEPFVAGTVASLPIPACWSPIQIIQI